MNKNLDILRKFEPLLKKAFKIYVRDFNYFDDAMQEGYKTILLCIKNFDESKGYHFNGYVKMAVIYSIRKFGNKINSNNLSLDMELNEEGGSLHGVLKSDEDIEENIIKLECNQELMEAIDKLTEKQREVIIDYYFNKISLIDISKKYRCHYMNVVALKDRGIKSLRKMLYK